MKKLKHKELLFLLIPVIGIVIYFLFIKKDEKGETKNTLPTFGGFKIVDNYINNVRVRDNEIVIGISDRAKISNYKVGEFVQLSNVGTFSGKHKIIGIWNDADNLQGALYIARNGQALTDNIFTWKDKGTITKL